MGERDQFPNQTQYYNANAMLNFLSDANANNHVAMNNVKMSFSKLQNSSYFDFQCSRKKQKNKT
jgi:hypothetical protein